MSRQHPAPHCSLASVYSAANLQWPGDGLGCGCQQRRAGALPARPLRLLSASLLDQVDSAGMVIIAAVDLRPAGAWPADDASAGWLPRGGHCCATHIVKSFIRQVL